ncbi:hypothetical protein GCM10023322_22780 [Rugosimonospora acidiphila]|uniref:Glycosyltransferase RgtA/B/C/D-like domain-containing protein n=1 Tax=Rugosimonospora acidiphila TaxID=556531 RepID=A0ABP9RPG6_9ACTN
MRLSWGRLFRLLHDVDAVLGPYYTVEKAWTTLFGTSTVALRLPSVLAMAAAAALVAVLGARLGGGRWPGLLAGLVFAVVPATSRYAQEARSYAFTILLAVLATWVLVRLLERPTAGRAAGYGVAVAGLGAAHLAGLLLLVGHAVAVLAAWAPGRRPEPASGVASGTPGGAQPGEAGAPGPDPARPAGAGETAGRAVPTAARAAAWRWLVAAGLAVLVLAPLARLGHRQRAQISWIAPSSWRTLAGEPAVILGDAGVGAAVVVLALLGLCRLGLSRLGSGRDRSGRDGSGRDDRAGTRPALLLAGWAVAPVVVLYLAGEFTPAFWPRYLLYTMPALVLLAAIFLAGIGRRWAVAALIVVALFGATAQAAIRGPAGHNHDTRGAAAIIAAGDRPGDAIAYALREPVVPWEARDIVARYVPADRRPRDVFEVAPQRVDGRLTATECPDLAGCLAAANPGRIWVLRYQSQPDPLRDLGQPKEDLLRAHYSVTRVWLLEGLTVGLLTRR